MTSREVIDRLLTGDDPPRMGIYERIWTQTLEKWATEQGYPVDGEGRPVDPHDHFGLDLVGVGGGIDTAPIRGYSELLEETDEWVVRKDGNGASLKRWKRRAGTPEHIAFSMTDRETWERDYRPHLLGLDPDRVQIEAPMRRLPEERAKGKWTFYGNLFVWEKARQSMGDICLYESMLLDPEWIHDYNRVYTDFFKAHFAYLIETAGKPDGVRICEDLGYKGGLFCSPETFDQLVFPYYGELIEFFHQQDLPVIFHTCGDVTEALPYLADLEIDALDPMEVKAGCDPLKFAEEYGDRFVLRGGMDVRIMESGDRDTIRKAVTELADGMKARGARYIFSSDHSITTDVDYHDYAYAVNVFKERMEY